MAIQDKITQLWVKATGRRIDPVEYSWLIGPVGDQDVIKDKFVERLAKEEDLLILKNEPNFGLLDSIDELGFSEIEMKTLHPEIISFYENTSNYTFEVWSEWKGIFKPFGRLLQLIFSSRLQQLNLPVRSIDMAKGIASDIIKLKYKDSLSTKWTIWYRTIKSTKNVIYSGVYTACKVPNFQFPLLKVIFPLPNGNASVVMQKSVETDGSLLLSSDGRKFGDHGFYFTLTNHQGKYWARYVKSMHEWIRVYVDHDHTLRADHNLNFYGIRFLNLHYKMSKTRNETAE